MKRGRMKGERMKSRPGEGRRGTQRRLACGTARPHRQGRQALPSTPAQSSTAERGPHRRRAPWPAGARTECLAPASAPLPSLQRERGARDGRGAREGGAQREGEELSSKRGGKRAAEGQRAGPSAAVAAAEGSSSGSLTQQASDVARLPRQLLLLARLGAGLQGGGRGTQAQLGTAAKEGQRAASGERHGRTAPQQAGEQARERAPL